MLTHPTWLLADRKLKCLSPHFDELWLIRGNGKRGPVWTQSPAFPYHRSPGSGFPQGGRHCELPKLQLCSRHVLNGLGGLLLKKTAFCKFSV